MPVSTTESHLAIGGGCGIEIPYSPFSSKSHLPPPNLHPPSKSVASAITASDGNGSSKYTALTPQLIYRHDVHQECFHGQGHPHAAQQQYVDTLWPGAETLDTHLASRLNKFTKEQAGMTPMERFEAPSQYPYHQYNRYSVETEPPNENSDFQSNTQHPPLTTSAVYIGDQYKPSAQGSPMYAPDVSRSDIVYYVPERTYLPQTSWQDKNVAGRGNDLAEIGAQFDSYATVDYI